MEIRSVEARLGWQWIADGFTLFRKNPLIWIVLCIILLLFAVVVVAVIPRLEYFVFTRLSPGVATPGIGRFLILLHQFVFTLLSPLLLAGLMVGCRALDYGEKPRIIHLLAGFRGNPTPLITVGGISLVGQVLLIGGFFLVVGDGIMPNPLTGEFHPTILMSADNNILPILMAAMVVVALSIPLMMATWFAPILVIFDDVPALAAMRLSFFACMKNLIPFLVYGAVLMVVIVIAGLISYFVGSIRLNLVRLLVLVFSTYPLGLLGLLLTPPLFASIYASYKNIFEKAASSQ